MTDDDIRHDISLALHTITETNQSIRFADTKAGALAGVQALMVTVLAAHQSPPTRLLHTACLAGVLTSALLLAAGQAPRLVDHGDRPSRASFPALAAMPAETWSQVPPLESRHQDAWRQAASLSRIAVTKYRWLTRAAVSTVVTLTAVLTWLACVTWPSGG